jgi:hypothetical protein
MLTGQNLDQIFNSKRGCVRAMYWLCNEAIWPKQELKTRPKQRLSYLQFYIALPVKTDRSNRYQGNLREGEGSVRMTSLH